MKLNPLVAAFISCFLIVFLPNPAKAEGILNLQLENDTYFSQDQHYTNGLTVSYLPINTSYPKLSSWLREAGLAHEDKDLFAEFSLTQALYTPEDIENPEPQPNDFPWAGHAYLGAKLSHHPLPFKGSWQMQQAAEVNLGIIGSIAGARFVQTKFHKLINSRDPKGWHNQLKNEPTAKLTYNLQLQKISALNEGLYFINQPEIGASLGSPFTHINTGWGITLINPLIYLL